MQLGRWYIQPLQHKGPYNRRLLAITGVIDTSALRGSGKQSSFPNTMKGAS